MSHHERFVCACGSEWFFTAKPVCEAAVFFEAAREGHDRQFLQCAICDQKWQRRHDDTFVKIPAGVKDIAEIWMAKED